MCSAMCKAMTPQKQSAENVEYSGKILFPFFQRLIRHSLKLIKEVQTKLLNPSEFFSFQEKFPRHRSPVDKFVSSGLAVFVFVFVFAFVFAFVFVFVFVFDLCLICVCVCVCVCIGV